MTKRSGAIAGFLLLMSLTTVALVARSADSDPAHWPQWRGPFFNGMARTAAPVEFGDAKNVKWKIPIPGRGFSTPVIWGDRIFLTTAVPTGKTAQQAQPTQNSTGGPGGGRGGPGGGEAAGEEHKFVVMCLDRKTGKSLWERVAKVAAPHEGYHRQYGSFASNSPLTDGKFVYASFGSRGIYCYDFDGKQIWVQDLGVKMKIRLQFGEGGAPALEGNALIIPFDQEGGSFIVALDKRNGKELWRTIRNESSNWSTPLVVNHKGKKQVVVSATNKVRAYDPTDGKLIWECGGLGLNVIPMPVQQNDLLFAMSGFRDPKLMAIRLGREGDLTNSDADVWSHTRGTGYTPSPGCDGHKLYTLTDNGVLSCFNATTGEHYYHQKRLPQPDSFKASPVGAGDKLYLASESGVVTVLKLGEQFDVVASNTFEDQMFVSSP